MGFSDFLKRLTSGKGKGKQRGVRGGRQEQRSANQGTVVISAPLPPAGPPPAPPAQPMGPPAAPHAAATVVTPAGAPPVAAVPPPQPVAPAPQPVAPAAAAPPPPGPAPNSEGATEYVDVRTIAGSQVVGVLVAVEGELEGSIFAVRDGENRLGRSSGCEIEMASKKISREHAKVVHQDGVFAIMPLSDQNPTFLNDEATEGSELNDGDFVKLGRTTLRFRSVV